ncbi:MAG: hypothetical protein KatS3mg105_0307 [Gemmatales bacterium]|nr:MAG: hypothetical protein KatS3mg105_0307 [Gemmatales bacterium]
MWKTRDTAKEVLQARRSGMGVVRLHPPGTGESPILFVAISARQPRGEVDIIRVSMPLDELEEQLAGLKQVMWTVAGVSVGASLLLACWLARRTIRPMQMLLDGAQHLASGDYGHKLNVYEHDDLAPVAQAFNHMSERLAAQFARIEEDRQQLRAVLSSMIEGVIAIDAEQRILFTNDRAEEPFWTSRNRRQDANCGKWYAIVPFSKSPNGFSTVLRSVPANSTGKDRCRPGD